MEPEVGFNHICAKEFFMRKLSLVLAAMSALMVQAPVDAKGCLRGAVAGGVAGHYVGKGHALAGAAAGCAIAHHHYAKQARAQKRAMPPR